MEQQLCNYLYISHSVDSKMRAKELFKKIWHKVSDKISQLSHELFIYPFLIKKWKCRWVVFSGNLSPLKCHLDYCKKESDWLSGNQSEITRCQLTNFTVQKFTGQGVHDNHLVISLGTYAICLAFESITNMNQWYGALERLLGTYYDLYSEPVRLERSTPCMNGFP